MKGGAEGVRGARRHATRKIGAEFTRERWGRASGGGGQRNGGTGAGSKPLAVSEATASGLLPAPEGAARSLRGVPCAGIREPQATSPAARNTPLGERKGRTVPPWSDRQPTGTRPQQKCPLGRRGEARKPRSVRGHRAKHAQECPEAKLKEGKADRGTREPPTKTLRQPPNA